MGRPAIDMLLPAPFTERISLMKSRDIVPGSSETYLAGQAVYRDYAFSFRWPDGMPAWLAWRRDQVHRLILLQISSCSRAPAVLYRLISLWVVAVPLEKGIEVGFNCRVIAAGIVARLLARRCIHSWRTIPAA